jgi:hypothetical protein
MTDISEFDPITFTCFITELAKKENVELMSDITQKIYELYEGCYDNYTLIELIRIVYKSGYKIDCPYNKIDIINMIESKGYNIPKLKEKMQATTWDHIRIRRSLDILQTSFCDFYEGSMIQLENGIIYDIDVVQQEEKMVREDGIGEWNEVVYVYLIPYNNEFIRENPEFYYHKDEEEICMIASEFIDMIDFDDITLVQLRDIHYFMSDEEEKYWTNYVRYM